MGSLLDCRLADLHPASWFAVLWSPIYRLPQGRDRQDHKAAFLTFHRIPVPLAGQEDGWPQAPPSAQAELLRRRLQMEAEAGCACVPVPAFGVVPSRNWAGIWRDEDPEAEAQHAAMLLAAAEWTERRRADHSDLRFFLEAGAGARAGIGAGATAWRSKGVQTAAGAVVDA